MRENKTSNAYAVVSALIFAVIAHVLRLNQSVDSCDWAVQRIDECIVDSLVVAALIAIWGFVQLG
jgi:hypothetical protein